MINPNIRKFVTVDVAQDLQTARYRNNVLRLSLRGDRRIKAGRRRLWLKYSILSEEYYLSDRP